MRIRIVNFLSFLIVFLACSSYATFDGDKDKVLMNMVIQTLTLAHYNPKDINDDFSQRSYDLYLKTIDVNKKFLTQDDVNQLNKFRNQIDDQIKNGSYEFYDLSTQILTSRIKEAEEYYKEILDKPFDFKMEETIELDGEKLSFAKDKGELKESWRKYLKYQTLVKLNESLDAQEKAKENKDTTFKVKSFQELEAEAREKVMKTQKDWFHRLSRMNNNDRLSLYVNSIVGTFDPHTNYMPPNDKENFDIAISGQLEGIGATLQEKDGNIKVMSIVPGSASWRQGQLKAGDIILKVAQGAGEPVDVVDMRLDEAIKLIRGKKGTEVRLTVKKLDGSIIVIPITRDIVILEETYAKSAVLQNGMKIGYIKLPQFYADFSGNGGRSCADDVKKEIAKLKQERIQGLILDLRNNGGGSLIDVVNMSGLFINQGPIVQIKAAQGSPDILEDTDPSIQYDGPLVILVNKFSASASEILAAAMQDYKRAVIIGSPSTFGKGTVQRIFDLDRFVPQEYSAAKPIGALKLTVQKFYRVNGGATQLKGVVPDIILPDEYAYLEMGEEELEYPMPWDEIKPAKYSPFHKMGNLETVKKNSKARVETNPAFKLINDNALRLKQQNDNTNYTLNFEKHRAEQHKLQDEAKKYENMLQEVKGLEVFNLKSEPMPTDTALAAITKEWHKNIKKDVYISEAISVIKDMK